MQKCQMYILHTLSELINICSTRLTSSLYYIVVVPGSTGPEITISLPPGQHSEEHRWRVHPPVHSSVA